MALGTVLGTLFMGGLSLLSFGPGIGDHITRFLNDTFEGRVPDITDVVRQFQRKVITQDEYLTLMEDIGFNNVRSLAILETINSELSLQEILVLWFRYRGGKYQDIPINVVWLQDHLLAIGLKPENATLITEANRPVPTIDDIIRFAVREVYDPKLRADGQLDKGLSENPRYLQEAAKRGLEPQDAKDYWAAHWQLPGIVQAFEFYHRLYDNPDPSIRFDDRSMESYFNVADIAPGYRERLKAISYNPYTRVDVRRMYNLGVFGTGGEAKAAVKRAYRDLGYDDDKAEKMTAFTVEYYEEGERELTRSQILQFYREGVYGEEGRKIATEQLQALNYSDTQIEWSLEYEDLKFIESEEQDQIDTIRAQYLKGEIVGRTDLFESLAKVGLLTTAINKLINQFESKRLQAQKRLTRTMADKLYKMDKMTEAEYTDYLTASNYNPKDIRRIIEYMNMPENSDVTLPSRTDITKWVQGNLIPVPEWITRMKSLGYNADDVRLYALQGEIPADPEQIQEAYL